MSKKNNERISHIKLSKPKNMEYSVFIEEPKKRNNFINRIEKYVRSSLEYRDYIQFIKENGDLDKCIFFNNITQNGNRRKKISLELHHEPFTLYDIVNVIVTKYQEEGYPLNDLDIADEVLELHYNNKIGLVPLCKTAHELVHNSDKLKIPLTAVNGNYTKFLEEYEPYCEECGLFDKLEKKLEMTKNLTEKDYEAILVKFKYVDVDGYEDINKLENVEEPVAV